MKRRSGESGRAGRGWPNEGINGGLLRGGEVAKLISKTTDEVIAGILKASGMNSAMTAKIPFPIPALPPPLARFSAS